MKDTDIIRKLADANLPRFVAETSLVKERAQNLRDIIASRAYKTPAGLTSYMLLADRAYTGRSARLAAVMGKELVLSGVGCFYVTLAGFLREIRLQDYASDREPILPILRGIGGPGYLIITGFDDVNSQPSSSVWLEGLDLILSHCARGGGVILVCDGTDAISTSPTFEQAASNFTVLSA